MVLNLNNPGLGAGVWAIFGFYLLAVFLAAIRDWFTRRRHKQDDSQHRASSLSDYLASGTSSSLVLTATLMMASQGGFFIYGVPVDAYTEDFAAFKWIPAFLFAVLGSLLVTPRLLRLSKIRRYESPVDFLNDRYRSSLMRVVSSAVMVVPMVGFLALQYGAIGVVMEIISQGTIPRLWGAIFIACIVLVLEAMGDLTTVTVTDIVHAAALLLAFMFMLIIQSSVFYGVSAITRYMYEVGNTGIVAVPSPTIRGNWILWSVPWIAFTFYPHYMTRVTSVRAVKPYRLALVFQTLLPFFAVPAGVLLVICSQALLPQLTAAPTISGEYANVQHVQDVLAYSIRLAMQQGGGPYFLGSMVFVAAVGCVMSIGGSVVQGVATVVTVDIYRPLAGSDSRSAPRSNTVSRLIAMLCSVSFTVFGVLLGNYGSLDVTAMVSLQNAVVLQVMPAFILGLYCRFATAMPIAIGMIGGVGVTLVCHFLLPAVSPSSYVPAGWIGMSANVVLTGVLLAVMGRDEPKKSDESTIDISISSSSGHSVQTLSSMSHPKNAGRFTTRLPERLIGYRIRLNRSWDDEDLEFEDRYHPEMSVSNVSTFSETYQADHARVGSTSLGSIGRVGDRCTEPIHNPILLGIVAFFLIMSSPLILSVGQDGSSSGLPHWVYMSLFASLTAAILIIYVMFASWDIVDDDRETTKKHGQASFSDDGSRHQELSRQTATEAGPPSRSMSGTQGPIQRQSSAPRQHPQVPTSQTTADVEPQNRPAQRAIQRQPSGPKRQGQQQRAAGPASRRQGPIWHSGALPSTKPITVPEHSDREDSLSSFSFSEEP
ncbi:Uncharacterized protein PBTT_00480 [Plasmodiophora brassicae]